MPRFILIFALFSFATCARPTPLDTSSAESEISSHSCGGGCTVSQTCSDIFSSCRVCYLGRCSNVLPAEPIPVDAGVDASTGTTP